jgi:hypothetical protein
MCIDNANRYDCKYQFVLCPRFLYSLSTGYHKCDPSSRKFLQILEFLRKELRGLLELEELRTDLRPLALN